jgi:hypothetical protein
MKKAIYTFITTLSFSICVCQTTSIVPESIKSKFAIQNPNAQNVKWTAFKNDCMVTYSVSNIYNESYYKMNGELILTASNLKEDQLPKKTNRYLDSIRPYTKIQLIGRKIDSKSDTTYQIKGETIQKKGKKMKQNPINLTFNSKGILIDQVK